MHLDIYSDEIDKMEIDKKNPIAVVGVSRDKEKYGFKVFKTLLENDFLVFAINPNADTILDQKVYPNLFSLPEKPDLVVIVTPPNVTAKIIDSCVKIGVRKVWLQPGSESENVIREAEDNGIDVVYNACIMIDSNKNIPGDIMGDITEDIMEEIDIEQRCGGC